MTQHKQVSLGNFFFHDKIITLFLNGNTTDLICMLVKKENHKQAKSKHSTLNSLLEKKREMMLKALHGFHMF